MAEATSVSTPAQRNSIVQAALPWVAAVFWFLAALVASALLLGWMPEQFFKRLLLLLQALTSWPAVTLLCVSLFFSLFKPQLEALVGRIKDLKTPAVSFAFDGVPSQSLAPQDEAQKKLQEIKSESATTQSPRTEPVNPRAEFEKAIVENAAKVADVLQEFAHDLDMERILNDIFATQIKILDDLARLGEAGTKITNLYNLYEVYSTMTKNAGMVPISFNEYLRFLFVRRLIERHPADGDSVRITPRGVELLSYGKSRHPNLQRFF